MPATAAVAFTGGTSTKTITAEFRDAPGLYAGNHVDDVDDHHDDRLQRTRGAAEDVNLHCALLRRISRVSSMARARDCC